MEQWRLTPFGTEATQAKSWLKCQPRSYLRLEAYGFVGLSEIDPETRYCMTVHERLMSEWILSLEPEHRTNRLATTAARKLEDHLGSLRCSSCLRLQLFGVETCVRSCSRVPIGAQGLVAPIRSSLPRQMYPAEIAFQATH